MDKVKRNQLNRFTILKELYECESSNGILAIDSPEFLEKCNISKQEIDNAIEFLKEKMLIENYGESAYSIAKINSYGKQEYERLVNSPNESGNYLDAIVNYIHIGEMNNSQIQQGSCIKSKNIVVGDYKKEKSNNETNDFKKANLLYQQITKLKSDLEFIFKRIFDFQNRHRFVNIDDPLLKNLLDDYINCKGELTNMDQGLFKVLKDIDLGKPIENKFTSDKPFYVNSHFDGFEKEVTNAMRILNLKKESLEFEKENINNKLIPFLSMSFDDNDTELNEYFKNILISLKIEFTTGERYSVRSIPEKVIKRIEDADVLIIVLVKREELKAGGYSTTGWLLKELGIALGSKKGLIALVENGIKDLGGLNMEKEIIYFSRDNLVEMQKATIKFLEALKENKLI